MKLDDDYHNAVFDQKVELINGARKYEDDFVYDNIDSIPKRLETRMVVKPLFPNWDITAPPDVLGDRTQYTTMYSNFYGSVFD